ncbi:MAG: fibronectin type III domain-containing protein, partial [Methanomassiliicoccales archaeon]
NGNLSVKVKFTTDGINWFDATPGPGSDPTELLENDTVYTFVWDSTAPKNIPDTYNTTVFLKIVPYDRGGQGTPGITGNFTVDNKAIDFIKLPTVTVTNTTAFVEWEVDEPANATVWYGPYVNGRISDLTTEATGSILTTYQSVSLTGLTPGRNYTFLVNSTDACGNKASSEIYSFETEVHIQLYAGWNMISLPPILRDWQVEEVLETIDGNYDIVQTFIVFDTDDPWKHYLVGKPFGNDLTYIESWMGLWVHMLNDDVLIPDHYDPTTMPMWEGSTIPLESGWNFVGYPSVRTRSIGSALSGVSYDLVQAYDAATDQWLSWDGTSGDLTHMEMGRGYWIHCTDTSEWQVDY